MALHHLKAFALGGATTEDNVSLRCRRHNLHAAIEDFGAEHMQQFLNLS